MRKKKEVPLSLYLKENVTVNRKAVNLQGKGITQIDEISSYLCSQIETLNLRNNKLVSINNLTQFSFLKELDISSNNIANCNQLECLRGMAHLKKLYFSNNPFLNDPIEEPMLELILEKETDIQVLSLELIKEVQNQQIKIIFLKNYLNKIELHEELKQKEYIQGKPQALTTDSLLNKIIPQFYTAIENPKLTSTIKKEALNLKKQSKESFEGALIKAKELRQKKINQLIEKIVQILHHSDTFMEQRSFMLQVNLNENTITFSPEKRGRKQFNNTVRIEEESQFSPVKYIQLSKDQNTFEEMSMSNAQKSLQNKSSYPSLKGISQPKPASPQDLDQLETARKGNAAIPSKATAGRLSSFVQFKQELQNRKQSQKQKEKEEKNNGQKSAKQQSRRQNFKTPEVRRRKNQDVDYIKVIDEENLGVITNKNNQQFQFSSNVSPKNGNLSTVSWRNAILSTEQLAPENIEIIYFKTLTKIHPMFSLLHSPASSLNNQQKNILLEALKASHKEHFMELVKEKVDSQSLMRQLDEMMVEYQQRIEQIVMENSQIYQENTSLKEENAWNDNRHRALQNDYNKLFKQFKEVENNDKNKSIAISSMESSFKKLKQSYTQKMEEVQRLYSYEENQEIIAEKHRNSLKKTYFNLLNKKAVLWKKVIDRKSKASEQKKRQLYEWGLEKFKENCLFEQKMRGLIRSCNQRMVRQKFVEWVEYVGIEKRQKNLLNKFKQKHMKQFWQLLKKNEALGKMIKLKDIWAKRFYEQHKYKLHYQMWKHLYLRRKSNQSAADTFYYQNTQKKYLLAIKELISIRKTWIECIKAKNEVNKTIKQFARMIYIMRKQKVENEYKVNQVRLYHQRFARKSVYVKIKINAAEVKRRRKSISSLNTFLRSKLALFFQKCHKKKSKILRKVRNYLYYIRFRIIKKCLKRQQKSVNYNRLLMAKHFRKFIVLLKANKSKRISFRKGGQMLKAMKMQKLQMLKLTFVKRLLIGRLKGRNYVKERTIQEMNVQMNLNDNCALSFIKESQQSLVKCEKEIVFLKGKVQVQSNREMVLLTEKDEMMLTINENYEIMMALRKEVDLIREESKLHEEKYNTLATRYNEAVLRLQKSEKQLRKDPTRGKQLL